jgi:hypothetical protein
LLLDGSGTEVLLDRAGRKPKIGGPFRYTSSLECSFGEA